MPKFLINFIEQFWRLFTSLKLTFILLVFIGLGAFLGMYFDQTVSFDKFIEINSQSKIYFWLSLFELNDAFHSWWFSLVILLLSFNLIICSFERLPRIYFDTVRPRPYLTDRRLLGLSLKKTFKINDKEKAKLLVKKFFINKKAFLKTVNNNTYFYAEKDKLSRFGVYIVHIALLVIMFSSIIATQTGIDGNVLIQEGEQKRFIEAKGIGGILYNYDLGFYVFCKDFRLLTFADNTPMEYESDLIIKDLDGNELAKQTVRVNNPLNYNNYTFYQSTFRKISNTEKSINILIKNKKNFSEIYSIDLNQKFSLPNKKIATVTKVYEDFAGLGEAIRIDIDNNNQKTFFHVFRKYPEFDEQVRDDEYNFILLGADHVYATGLSVSKMPGISVIFSGFFLLLIGLYMCFFKSPTRYFARISKSDNGFRIDLALQAFRNQNLAKSDFIKRALNNV